MSAKQLLSREQMKNIMGGSGECTGNPGSVGSLRQWCHTLLTYHIVQDQFTLEYCCVPCPGGGSCDDTA